MIDTTTRRPLQTALDFSKLLGFKRVAGGHANVGTPEDQLARALGATCNKVGEVPKHQVDTNGVLLAVAKPQ